MKDFILNEKGKVVVSESTRQHQQDLLVMDKGWQKFFPTRGVGLFRQIGDEGAAGEWQAAIKSEFQRDGMQDVELNIENGKLKVDAAY